MVVPFVNLPMHMFQADHAMQAQIAHNATATGHTAVAAQRVQDRAEAKESSQIAEMDEEDGLKIDSESGSAHSHTLAEEGGRREAQDESPHDAPDPTGRGNVLDLSA